MSETLALSPPLAGLRAHAARLSSRANALWRAYPRETLGFGVLGLIVAGAIGGAAYSMPDSATPEAAPPAPPPLLVRQIAPEAALKVNAAIPVTAGPNPAAQPFAFKGGASARAQALQCLASAVYYEAGSQDDNGERAVAQVVLNRVRHPAFPSSVCGVVYQGSTRVTGCQFTFTCDGSLYRQPDADGWRRATRIAEAALSGFVYQPVGYATHYHADYVVPYWASTLAKNAVVGAHIFYRWAGGWGAPAAFAQKYAGHEANAVALRNAALAVEHVVAGPSSVAEAVDKIPGAEALPLKPSMRGDKRVAVRFNLTARKASEAAVHEDYVEKFEASDNLKYALSGETVAVNAAPLGKPAPAAPRASAGGGTVAGAGQR
ncbi:MAG TPA: cell wall hydrolase [Sphingomicrobium sp.]|nr:cell wall hydrolase [Sphingomicrobium sp.]